ncbi:iron complex transport system substrate-binding protein [Herbihabitans rhizosphaerae]|uniref:Iron complex transport system substrate-binding protein n=1 Tax=Herbihabitans rhizosphaerae TaxID=1872711 RepID=A0A4Q7L1T0_9PSEU|nr:iron-siderophore ABC transporter substrate-binding protein [Herbihabitans rhizosphaerae]RZS43125.1 iron complex transport system substrate-binding protein [Herbihabitans rhizosphaerae]
MLSSRTRVTTAWKRTGIALTAIAATAGLLAGCGSESSGGAPADTENLSIAGATAGTFPTTVEHAFGTTEIKQAPKRVVSLGYTDDQAILGYGIRPVGMVDQYSNPPGQSPDINTQWPWVKGVWATNKPEVIMTNGDPAPNYEKIAALRPDLIVAVYSDIDQAAYDRLTKIAPTVGRTKAEKEPFSAPWQDNALQIAKALGKPDEGAKAIKAIDDKFAAARQAHPELASKTAVAVSWYKNSIAPFTTTDVRGRILTNLGFKGVTEIDKIAAGKFYTTLSPERVDLINVDRIFVIGDQADQQALKNFPLFANLPAVREGRVSYVLDSEEPAVGAAMSQSTVLSLPYAIDEIVKAAK